MEPPATSDRSRISGWNIRPDWGWVAWDPANRSCTGRPWDVLPAAQGGHPPEGDWVSRKGAKSYVYSLVYVG
ncbi:hypothetical protein ACE10Z_39210 [Bradyrhizobium sp. Pha-3]|uniref:hypothetical protein n=1 Tax=Bradyrhizobium sp. Pha-3 TaxID=208375 RepID=UPI0035D4150F